MDLKTAQENTTASTQKSTSNPHKINFKILGIIAALLVSVLIAVAAFMWYSPGSITNPILTHYHLRIQLLTDGQAVNFGDQKFQTPFEAGLCNADLPAEPMHFHDAQDQILHLHWNKITGGQFLKNYGWSKIGGVDDSLGFRLDTRQNVPIFGKVLPYIEPQWNHYVYIGDRQNYQIKNFNDFLNQDFETFIGKQSRINQEFEQAAKDRQSNLPKMTTAVLAHETGEKHSEVDLEKLNDLIGNIVIFSQTTEPTNEQIKDRFNQLVDLPNSTCGG